MPTAAKLVAGIMWALMAWFASNLIKPLLSSGQLRCIGSTTYQEYQGIFEKDRALARRFQKIDIIEPSVSETTRILNGLKARYESHHEVRYTAKALQAAAELSAQMRAEQFQLLAGQCYIGSAGSLTCHPLRLSYHGYDHIRSLRCFHGFCDHL